MRCVGVVVVAGVVATAAWAPRAEASPALIALAERTYVPPVRGPVVDPFRQPAGPYAAGNRGWEVATAAGDPVRASGGGQVVFAGPVAGALHVTILHPDGLRTSYSYLAEALVVGGQVVAQGDQIGTASQRFHFGVRDASGSYLDPALVLTGRDRARLVPGVEEGRDALEARERSILAALVDATSAVPGAVLHDVGQRLAMLEHYRRELDPGSRIASMASGMAAWARAQRSCTPAEVDVPRLAERRVAVLVAGLGSTSEAASIDELDTTSVGYAQADVVRFSYRGGRVPDARDGHDVSSVPAASYDSTDSQQDLRASAAALATMLAEVAQAAPGVPIDVLAHSQGGLVARLALDGPGLPDEVATIVTLGTPHQGADLATAASAVRITDLGTGPEARVASLGGLDHRSSAIRQLSETSDVVAELRNRRAGARDREDVRITSIAARGDVVVPVPATIVQGGDSRVARHVVVPLVGPGAHRDLPGSELATREVALAIAGQGPTCTSMGTALLDVAVGEALSASIDAYGAARSVAALPLP